MEPRQGFSEAAALLDPGAPHRDAVEEGDQRRRSPGELAQIAALAVVDRQRTGDAARGEMLHQREEIGQVLPGHALLVKREDIAPGLGLDQVVGILDALGNALAGREGADVVAGDEVGKLLVGDLRVDRHARAPTCL